MAELPAEDLGLFAAQGLLVVVVTNEDTDKCIDQWHCTHFNQTYAATVRTTDGRPRSWRGYSFRGDAEGKFFNVSLGARTCPGVACPGGLPVSLQPNEIQWWFEQPRSDKRRAKLPPDISRYQIVLGSEATAGERYAAARLQSLLGRLRANLSLPIVPQAGGCCQLAVGATAAISLLPSLRPSLPQLGDEGFALATDQASWSVAITGADGSPRACLYGVHRFLELLGYDFLSWDATNTPVARADVWPGPLWLT